MGSEAASFLMWVGIAIFALFILKIFFTPIKFIFKLIINAALGLIGLALFNWLGGFIGISLGINLINTLVVGFLGVPGLILLLIIKWLWG